MSLLRVENLQLSIHGQTILRDIDLSLNAGKILGVLGESGSGKSLTALSIMNLLPNGSALSGSIYLDQVNLMDLGEQTLCDLRGNDVSMIFQEPMTSLNPVHTIGDQVLETILVHTDLSKAEAEKIARKTLDRVGLPAEEFPLHRYPHDLSGGQRQRVMIAMAIALEPKLLIADEPTTALDVTTQAEILSLLKELTRDSDMALMLITHDLAVVAQMADDIVVMKNGEIVENGASADFFKAMAHPYTKSLLAASKHVPVRNRQMDNQGQAPVLKVQSVCREYLLPKKNLWSRRQKFSAVDDVSFSIQRGENLGLVGGSGCGKSTLARAILALDRVSSGEIFVDGRLFSARDKMPEKSQRASTQVVFQDPYSSFNPRHKVRRLIAEPFFMRDENGTENEREYEVHRALEEVGLSLSDADKYIHEFSGGQRQRIAIARALIIKPALIILDEAVSALDVSIRAQVLDLLAELSDRLQLSYLFISHDLSVVRAITDRVLVMQKGRIVEEGRTSDVFENPQHDYTKSLIKAIPTLDA